MSERGTTVILGWDALDDELLDDFGLSSSFGEHQQRIDTFDNPILNEPHTRELWPSLITGVRPEQHGIWAAEEGGGIQWENPVINRTSNVADGIVPESIRTRIGKLLRERGERVQHVRADYYEKQGVDTIFTGRRARAISVPNYYTPEDERLGFTIDRTNLWRDVLSVKDAEEEGTVFESHVSLTELDERLYNLAAERLSVVQASLQREYDIVFVWLAFIDSVGHLAPTIEEKGWQERHYHQAARFTEAIREMLEPEDTLVCVSDHGLRNGAHTHDPVIASDNPSIVEGVESILDVKNALETVTASRQPIDEPPVREGFQGSATVKQQTAAEVEQHLDDLGYL